MRRTKFPYTAQTSARVIRHAVSIDERRAKFRQDLISANRKENKGHQHHHPQWHHSEKADSGTEKTEEQHESDIMFRRRVHRHANPNLRPSSALSSAAVSAISVDSGTMAEDAARRADRNLDLGPSSESDSAQDVLEVWFAGK